MDIDTSIEFREDAQGSVDDFGGESGVTGIQIRSAKFSIQGGGGPGAVFGEAQQDLVRHFSGATGRFWFRLHIKAVAQPLD